MFFFFLNTFSSCVLQPRNEKMTEDTLPLSTPLNQRHHSPPNQHPPQILLNGHHGSPNPMHHGKLKSTGPMRQSHGSGHQRSPSPSRQRRPSDDYSGGSATPRSLSPPESSAPIDYLDSSYGLHYPEGKHYNYVISYTYNIVHV